MEKGMKSVFSTWAILTVFFVSNVNAVPILGIGTHCDRKVSSQGYQFFTIMMFGFPLDMPCPPETLYDEEICDCDHVSKVRPKLDAKGQTQTTKSTTKAPVTSSQHSSAVTEATGVCKNRKQHERGYMEYYEHLNDWVYFECSSTQFFDLKICDCTDKDPDPLTEEGCSYKATPGGKGFMEYVSGIGDVYSDCPFDHVFNANLCRCVHKDHPDCPYTANGVHYKEFIPGHGTVHHACVGVNVTFDPALCACKKQYPVVTTPLTTPSTPQTTAFHEDVSHAHPSSTIKPCDKRILGNGYLEHLEGIGDIYRECPLGEQFDMVICACPDKISTTYDPTITTNNMVTLTTTAVPVSTTITAACDYVAKDDGFTENIPGIGEVFSSCPSGERFVQHLCKCVTSDGTATNPTDASINNNGTGADTHVDDHTVVITDKDVVACNYVAKDGGFTENIPGIGEVFSSCPSGERFVQLLCKCLAFDIHVVDRTSGSGSPGSTNDHGSISTTSPAGHGEVTTNGQTTLHDHNTHCGSRVKKDKGFLEYFPQISDWVYHECPAGHEFRLDVCECVSPDGTGSSANNNSNSSDSDCNKRASGSGYVEIIEGIGEVYSDCPGPGWLFHEGTCKCIKTDSSENPSSGSCHLKPSGRGFIETIPNVGDVYNDCPSTDMVFDVHVCACVRGDPNSPSGQIITIDNNNVVACQARAHDSGFVDVIDGIGDVYSDCPVGQRFVELLCRCVDKDVTIIDNRQDDITVGPSPAVTTSVSVAPGCKYKASSSNEREYLFESPWMKGQYIQYYCDEGQVFDSSQCKCVADSFSPGNNGCPFLPSNTGPQFFRFEMFGLGWVEFSCHVNQLYDYNRCMCLDT